MASPSTEYPLGPLKEFCQWPETRKYVKYAHVGDAWRTLNEQPVPDSQKDVKVVETTFDLIFKISTSSGDESVQISKPTAPLPEGRKRHLIIRPEIGTDFLWRHINDLSEDEEPVTIMDLEDLTPPVPGQLAQCYAEWVDIWTEKYTLQLNKTGDHYGHTFTSPREEAAWNVTGFLLAWRIVRHCPAGSSITYEYKAGGPQFKLEEGSESSIASRFLKDQAAILAKERSLS
ncbi:hypothetical protein N7462_010887 [Penicillium macrosclerotiorum]|uniref:uncharacterized protein n=1 Tax=Penicillium macrosclerotiorum TaxID=303699 RepID=UPI002546D732|nr:uncharacterized protein N7462_010887 [Penicillium macrosclerotiorum]KAJ5669817.1 hypothetical protein N7462_010887 [Penicillium macrosclerotiorum]